MAEENLMKEEFDIFEKEITFADKDYSKIRKYFDINQYMKGSAGKGCMVYLTNHLDPHQLPYSVILSRRGWDDINNLIVSLRIQKKHPMKQQIKKDLEKLMVNSK